MDNDNSYPEARSIAARSVIDWFKNGKDYLDMRQKVNACLEASGANNQSSQEGLIAHRKLAANHLLIYSIYGLDKDQIAQADSLLQRIAEEDAPDLGRGRQR